LTAHPVITAIYYSSISGDGYFGVFNVTDQIPDFFTCCLSDGLYTSEITGELVTVKNRQMRIPIIFDIVSFSGQKGMRIVPVSSFLF